MKNAKTLWLAAGLLLIPLTASADIVLPTLGFFWPFYWFLFIPVVLVEAWVMKRMLVQSWSRSIKVSAGANLVSTFVGMPAATVLLGVIDYLVTGIKPVTPDTWYNLLYLVTVQSTGLTFFHDLDASIGVAMMVFTVILFFLSSVLVEYLVAKKMLRETDHALVRKWSWQANLVSYSMIGFIMIFGYDTFWRSLLNLIYG